MRLANTLPVKKIMPPLRGLVRLDMINAYKNFTAARFLMRNLDKFNPGRGDMLIENAS